MLFITKKNFYKMNKNKFIFFVATGIVFLFMSNYTNAQVTQTDTTLRYPIRYNINPLFNDKFNSPLYLQMPTIYTEEVVFDPQTGNFVITPKIGDVSTANPFTMKFDEYNKYRTNQMLRNNWKAKMKSEADPNSGDFLSDFLNPKLNLGIKGMDKIFGSDKITVTPSGNVDISLGLSYYEIDNKVLSKRDRRNFNFDFVQDIQLGVNGKVGDKMNVGINYNTKALFDFENRKKIDYTGEEDEIIQKIEAGNITFPIENSLIPGSTTLFGIRTDLKFGNLTVSSLFSHQEGESKTIEIQGGAVLNEFNISCGDYQANKHFFLNHYFRSGYEKSLEHLPLVTSEFRITRIEVWVTNKSSNFENARNIVGFLDLGETGLDIYANDFILPNLMEKYPSNKVNSLYESMTTIYGGIRDVNSVSSILSGIENFAEGVDYVKLESARKLNETEFSVNNSLGFISINYQLRPGEILAVAYEYTVNGEIFQVGEFSSDIDAPQTLIVKLLKGPASTPSLPNWDLMMKNIYSLETYSLSREEFNLEVFYNNDITGTPINYIPEGEIANQRLLSVLNLDNADIQNNPNPDGFFDFIEGITVDAKRGLIIFPMLEPFGNYLETQIGSNSIATKYSFPELYDSTQYIAQQIAVKNKFYLQGKFKSSGGSEISLNVMNLPQGSVVVTQGGQKLVENQDYTVDYNIGRVKILNESLLNSGLPIKISLESNDMFGMTTKSLVGTHLNYQFNPNFNIGSTVLHLSELPMDPKTRFGTEPISNTMFGFNTNFSKEVPFITKMIDFLPFIETKAPSLLTISAEFAQLIPGNPKIIDDVGTSFLDDFENSQTSMEQKSPQYWVLSSVPQLQPDLFPEAIDGQTLKSGYNRALLSWYDISKDFTDKNSTLRPSYITDDDLSNHLVRQIIEKEIFPNRQDIGGIPTRMTILNLAFYPEERGPYNYDVEGVPGISTGIDQNGNLKNPETRWAGIMRDLYINDFESANIGFIEIWMLDPFIYDSTSTGGYFYINLGDISEDILKDGRKSVENGIPYPPDALLVDTTQWGIVTKKQMTTQNFDNNATARKIQDAGLDGLLDEEEKTFFDEYLKRISELYGINSTAYQNALKDPSADNFVFFFGTELDEIQASITERYKKFNRTEANSPINDGNQNFAQAVTLRPDMEDVNRDNTLDNYEAYYQYKIHLHPDEMEVGQNYIVNKIQSKVIDLPNGDKDQVVTWYQFKIPLYSPDKVVGNVQGFKSIRFMRLFMTGFETATVLRIAELNLIKDEWRIYQNTISEGGEGIINPQPVGNGSLDISVVSIEESTQKEPVNYIMPPEVDREVDFFDQQTRKLNEQAMTLKVVDLPDGEAKGVYKNLDMDLRKYKFLKMYVHAEALINEEALLKDYDLSIFVRLGSDFTQNYYEYEIPLKKTPAGRYVSSDEDKTASDRYIVWPTENELNLSLEQLVEIKQQRNSVMNSNSMISISTPFYVFDGINKISIVGNPNLSNVKSIMIGIRNPKKANNLNPDDGQTKSGEIWINEFRLTDFNSNGGWAANTRINTNLADFGNLSLSGYIHTPGFGSIEKRVSERYLDRVMEYDITSQLQFGKFFDKEYGVSIPLYIGFSQSYSTPEYNPFDPDIKYQSALDYLPDDERSELKNAAQSFIQRKSFNLTNINIQGKPKTIKKINNTERNAPKKTTIAAPWKISNFSTSIAFSEIYTQTPIIEQHYQQNLMLGFNYNYAPTTNPITPFAKVKFLNNKFFQIIKDFNFYYLPTRIGFSSEVNRQYVSLKNRQVSSEDILLPTSYQKNFLWSRNYDISYKLTKGLKIDFTANNAARIEADGWRDQETLFERMGLKHPSDTILFNIYDFGKNTDYTQQIRVNYKVPINKLPLLDWTSLTADYSVNYDWRKGQDPFTIVATDTTPEYIIDFANTIQNASTIRLTGNLNFSSLYNNVKYLKKVNQRFTKTGRTPVKTEEKVVTETKTKVNLKKGNNLFLTHNLKTDNITKFEVKAEDGTLIKISNYQVVNATTIKIVPDTTLKNVSVSIEGKKKENENLFIIISDYTLKSMMMLQSISINYKKDGGTLLNGYIPNALLFGSEKRNNIYAPGVDFIIGLQDRLITDKFAQNGWITDDTLFNLPINFTSSDEIRVKVNIEPINNFKIDVNFQRNIALIETKYGYTQNNTFIEQTRMMSGGSGSSFYISFNTIRSAFENFGSNNDSTYQSEFFDKFLENRGVIAYRLAEERNNLDPNYDMATYTDSLGNVYPVGYSPTSQAVLIPAFLAAYSGTSPDAIGLNTFLKIPLPDWRVTYDGLGNLPFVKDFVKKITISHAYASTYTVNSFNSNPNFDFDNYDLFGFSSSMYETNGTFIPQYEINGIVLSEKFTPFFGIDITWIGTLSTRFEYKRSRDLFLSFSNNQIREKHNNMYTIGAGYTIKELKMNIKVGENAQKLNSDLILRLDITFGNDIEIYRKIVESIAQPNTQRNKFELTGTADYSINNKLNIQFYYNHSIAETNATPKTTNIQGGFKIRFALTP